MNQTPQNMDHLNETMLYKCPGPHQIHGGHFDYVIVPEVDIEEAKAQGWHLTTEEARAAREAAITAPPPPLPVPAAGLSTTQDYMINGVPFRATEQITQPSIAPAIVPAQSDNTAHLMTTQANAAHMETSIEQANAGQSQVRELTPQELNAPATYDEMKTKATQLGLEYPGNISKAALLAMITAKLAEQV